MQRLRKILLQFDYLTFVQRIGLVTSDLDRNIVGPRTVVGPALFWHRTSTGVLAAPLHASTGAPAGG